MLSDYYFSKGNSPLLLSFPHNGSEIPQAMRAHMTKHGLSSVDTDWFVRDLYHCADELQASTLTAKWSRYVVDLNRPAEDIPLYPGQLSTGLCPSHTFDGQAVYQDYVLDKTRIEERVQRYWQPYHDQLHDELQRIKQQHGYAILWDAHSIRGFVGSLFDGRLPDLNFGTYDQRSADSRFAEAFQSLCNNDSDYSTVLNGRFKGGYITRHYGSPDANVHAIQLEINQQTYLKDELQVPPSMDIAKSRSLARLLKQLLQQALSIGQEL